MRRQRDLPEAVAGDGLLPDDRAGSAISTRRAVPRSCLGQPSRVIEAVQAKIAAQAYAHNSFFTHQRAMEATASPWWPDAPSGIEKV